MDNLEAIANNVLEKMEQGIKPNYSNKDFMNCSIIFMDALMDKMYDNQEYDDMDMEDRMLMATKCGEEFHKLIHTYTGLDTHETEKFV